MRGVRDFFVLLFFVFFGSFLTSITPKIVTSAIIFSLFILIGNPIIIMTLMRTLGYKKRTNFLTGISLAQISEFSLVFILLGFNLGLIGAETLSLIVLIALITIAGSSYSIFYSHKLYNIFSPALNIFNGSKNLKIKRNQGFDTILFGYNRLGFNLLQSLKKGKRKYLIVDHDPEIISYLSKKGIPCMYGDARDSEFLQELNLQKANLIISTIPEMEPNLTILDHVSSEKSTLIVTAHSIADAEKLYSLGADYVIMPHFVGGEHIGNLLLKMHFKKNAIHKEGEKQKKDLTQRWKKEHSHPKKDFYNS